MEWCVRGRVSVMNVLSLPCSHSYSVIVPLLVSRWLSPKHTFSFTYSLTQSLSLSLTHTHTHMHAHTHSHSLTQSLSLSHTHTHTVTSLSRALGHDKVLAKT